MTANSAIDIIDNMESTFRIKVKLHETTTFCKLLGVKILRIVLIILDRQKGQARSQKFNWDLSNRLE